MGKELKVAIVVINFNGLEDTLECLSSLQHCAYANKEVIVVDNASENGAEAARELRARFPLVRVIENKDNLGFGGGANTGIRYALEHKADYVFLLNNDAMVAPDTLMILVEAAQKDSSIGIVGPHIYFVKDQNRLWYAGGTFTWVGGGWHIGMGLTDMAFTGEVVRDTGYMTGCALLIKREVIERIGPLPELYFMYYEDVEWSLRARRAGYRIVVAGLARVWHKVSQSTEKLGTPTRHYYDIRNRLLLARRNAPLPSRIFVYAWSYFFYVKQLVKIALFPQKRAVSRALMRGVSDFWEGKFGKHKTT